MNIRATSQNFTLANVRETSPFVVMFQQIEQSALRDNVMNWSTGQAVTSAAYWQVTK